MTRDLSYLDSSGPNHVNLSIQDLTTERLRLITQLSVRWKFNRKSIIVMKKELNLASTLSRLLLQLAMSSLMTCESAWHSLFNLGPWLLFNLGPWLLCNTSYLRDNNKHRIIYRYSLRLAILSVRFVENHD